MKKHPFATTELNQTVHDSLPQNKTSNKKIKVMTLVINDDFMTKLVIAMKARYGRISHTAVKSFDELKTKISLKKYDYLVIKCFESKVDEPIADLISELSSRYSQTKIIVLTDEITMPMFYYMNYLGASGIFLLEDTTPKSLADMLTEDLKDQILYSPQVLKMLISAFHR